jgi:hypothetical protein
VTNDIAFEEQLLGLLRLRAARESDGNRQRQCTENRFFHEGALFVEDDLLFSGHYPGLGRFGRAFSIEKRPPAAGTERVPGQ